jgi:FdhD protein
MLEYPVSRIDVAAGRLERKKDYVAEEKPIHIFVNQDRYVTILCTPRQARELAIGHLLSEGIVKSIQEIKQVQLQKDGKCIVRLISEVDVEKRISVSQPFARLIVSACGSPNYWPLSKLIDRLSLSRIPAGLKVKAETVLESVKRLNTLAEIFRKTGGVHVAALYSASGDLLTFSEDVGRHNAVDKVVGAGALDNLDFERCFLASSGRLTGDIVLKSARMRIPIIGSIAAAVNSGIDVAQRTGTTLIGFARGRRMNVYTYAERIELA